MEPMTTRLANALDSVRIDNGYHMILNSQDGSGLSIVLSAPAEDDLTRKVLKQLGVDPKLED